MRNLEQSADWGVAHSLTPALSTRSEHLGRLLHRLSDAFDQRTLAKCHQRGHRKFRSSHGSIIASLDAIGMSLGDLAERVGISQQATGKLVRDLERAGYVNSHPDIHDKRSRIILLTQAGVTLKHDVSEILREVREEFIQILGDNGLHKLEQQLRQAIHVFTSD